MFHLTVDFVLQLKTEVDLEILGPAEVQRLEYKVINTCLSFVLKYCFDKNVDYAGY